MPLSAGDKVGPYEILAPIGAGGMGEVYKALDTRLGRAVALKFSRGDFSARFHREARAVAALNHPNIVTIYDVGTENGHDFIAMEYVEGRSLSALIGGEPVPLDRLVAMGTQIAAAISRAHQEGIVHRDLKPANVVVTAEGTAKVLDFGLAKRREKSSLDETVTQDGTVLGTIGYMSPEQLRGEGATAASDVFALGCVISEMATGRAPFKRRTAMETASAILHDPPDQAPFVSDALAAIIRRCVEKDASRRYPSAREVESALRGLTVAAADTVEQETDSLAVMPFVNASENVDAEYLSEGIAESIINNLAQLPGLRVVPRTSAFRFKGKEVQSAEIARRLNVRTILTGKVMERGGVLRVQVDLIDAHAQRQLWGERFQRRMADVFELEEQIALEITERLRLRWDGDDKRRLSRRHTHNTDAYQLFLKGRHQLAKRTYPSITKAIELFREAVKLDPGYAAAHAASAEAFHVLCYYGVPPREVLEQAFSGVRRAVELDPESVDAIASLGFSRLLLDWDLVSAVTEYRRALSLNPQNVLTHDRYAFTLAAMGRFDEAVSHIRKAIDLDPLAPHVRHHAAWILNLARLFEQALEECRQLLELEADYGLAYMWRAMALGGLGRYCEAVEAATRAESLLGGVALAMGTHGYISGSSGDYPGARRVLEEMIRQSTARYVDPYAIALVYTAIGETEAAMTCLEQAAEDRSGFIPYLSCDYRLDPLRSMPQFQALSRRFYR